MPHLNVPISVEIHFYQNQLQNNILMQLLRICKFITSWIKSENISFSHLNINIAPYGSIRLALAKLQQEVGGRSVNDHSGLGRVYYDLRGQKGKFCTKSFLFVTHKTLDLFMLEMICLTQESSFKNLMFHIRLVKMHVEHSVLILVNEDHRIIMIV